MKKLIIAIVALFTFGAFSASAQKFGHIDYIEVMDSLATYKKGVAKTEELTADFDEQIEAIQIEYETKARELQEKGTTMPQIILETRQRELQELGAVAQNLEQQYQQSVQTVQTRYYVPLEKWLKEAVEIVGKRKGLDYILYYNEEQSVFWVNPDKGVDVTNDVLTEMLRLEKENPIKEPGE